MISVPFSDTGVVPEELERLAREEKSLHRASNSGKTSGKPFWAVFYTIPVYHNPTGVSASQGEPSGAQAKPSQAPAEDEVGNRAAHWSTAGLPILCLAG